MVFEWTPKQEQALKLAKSWWNSDEKYNKPFTLAGIAGSGKSTLITEFIDIFNLKENEVAYVTYTGMAASVLSRKGNNATTIHKLIYDPYVDPETNDVRFIKKNELSHSLKLIIIDEISMVSNNLLEDIMSFGKPILTSGDPCQLPPVMDNINDLLSKPDIFLDEPLRQSLDNPIIFLANKARNKEHIKYGEYGDNVIVIPSSKIKLSMYKNADQIIACKNATVDSINSFYRKMIKEIKNKPFPTEGEKIICLKNNWNKLIRENNIDYFLTNGLIGYCEEITDYNANIESFRLNFRPYYCNNCYFNRLLVDGLYFKNNIKSDSVFYQNIPKYGEILGKRAAYTEEKLEKIDKFTFGYAITCHKAQGSEYNNVLFISEFYNRNIYYNSLYTGITRAKDKLVLVK